MLCLHAVFSVIFRVWVFDCILSGCAGAVALVLPVREPLQLVLLVVNLIFIFWGILQVFYALPKF